MAQVTLNIPDAQVDRITTAFLGLYASGTAASYDTPAKRAAFVKSQLAEHIKNVVKGWESQQPDSSITIT